MPRGSISAADRDLLDAVGAYGSVVSEYQLERWRGAGLLPRALRSGLGRGRGSQSSYREEALPMALILANTAGQGRSLHAAALELFMFGYPVPESTIRRAMAWSIDRIERRAARVRAAGLAAENRALARAKRQFGVDHPILLAYSVGEGLPLAERRERRRGLKEATGMVVDLVLNDALPTAGTIVDILRASGLPNTADIVETNLIRAELAGETGWEGRGLDVLRQLVAGASVERLRAARYVGGVWLLTFNFLLSAARLGDPTAADMVRHLESEEHTRYVLDEMSWFSGPESITTGLLNLATNDLAFDTTWDLCRDTFLLARAVYMAASGVAVLGADGPVIDGELEALPEEVPDLPALDIEGLWRLTAAYGVRSAGSVLA